MPTNTYVALATQTVTGSSVADVTFSSIPSTYTDLVLVVDALCSAGSNSTFLLQFNSDAGNSYSRTFVYGDGSTAASGRDSSQSNGMALLSIDPTNRISNIVQIFNYANTTTNKTAISRIDASSNVSAAVVGLWRSTAAINSIKIFNTVPRNISVGSTFTIYGIAASPGVKATGGYITSDSQYIYHTFLSNGTFTPTQALTADILVVAGGGGGGSQVGGGGGAGGLLALTSQSLTTTGYTCTVGGGGAPGTYTNTGPVTNRGSSGVNSQFGALTAAVGGGGGGGYNGWAGLTGGSGGGSDGGVPTGNGAGTAGQGFAGGQGFASQWAGGGGGGAGAVGANASANVGGNGGIGATSAFINAIGAATNTGQLSSGNYYFAGGGGGCNTDNTAGNVGTGGLGGGARGTNNSQTTPPAGTINTGGGGGGSRDSISPTFSLPSAGGSGVVIVRYLKA